MRTVSAYRQSSGESVRVKLPEAVWQGSEEIGTGVKLLAVYVGPKSKRIVYETYSIWQNQLTGCCVGRKYTLVETEDQRAWLSGLDDSIRDAIDAVYPAEAL